MYVDSNGTAFIWTAYSRLYVGGRGAETKHRLCFSGSVFALVCSSTDRCPTLRNIARRLTAAQSWHGFGVLDLLLILARCDDDTGCASGCCPRLTRATQVDPCGRVPLPCT